MKKVALLAAVAGANVFERISRRARVDWKDLIDKVGLEFGAVYILLQRGHIGTHR